MRIKTVVIDDEPDAVNFIRSIIEDHCPELEVTGFAHSADEGEAVIRRSKPALVFLDVEMPMGNGFDLLTRFPKKEFEVIFVTAFDHYAIRAIKFSAVDYILKPIRIREFTESVNKYLLSCSNGSHNVPSYDLLLENLHAPMPLKLAISAFGGVEYLTITDILRIESDGSYSNFFMKNGKKIMVSRNLKEYHELLSNHSFFRAHHSHLINLMYVKRFMRLEGIIELDDGSRVPVSRSKKALFLHQMSQISK
jgi:two-component system LytT family response regulator